MKRIKMTLLQACQTVLPQISETLSRSYWGQEKQKRSWILLIKDRTAIKQHQAQLVCILKFIYSY